MSFNNGGITPGTNNNESYIFDQFMDLEIKSPQESHQESFRNFLTYYKTHLMLSYSLATSSKASSSLHNFTESINDILRSQSEDEIHAAEVLLPSFSISKISFSDPPFHLQTEPLSVLRADELLQTEHRTMKKILMIFSVLIEESKVLKSVAMEHFIPKLALFGEGATPQEGVSQLQFGRILKLLTRLWNLVERINVILKHLIVQLAALYKSYELSRASKGSNIEDNLESFSRIMFPDVFEAVSSLLGLLIIFDSTIRQNDAFTHCLTRYKRLIGKVLTSPEEFETTTDGAIRLERLLERLENDILDSNMLIICLKRIENSNELDELLSNQFKKMFLQGLIDQLNTFTSYIGSGTSNENPKNLLGLVGFFLIYSSIFNDLGTQEKKIFKDIWSLHKRLPVVHIFGNVYWDVGEFLRVNAGKLLQQCGIKAPEKDIDAAKKTSLTSLDSSLETSADTFYQKYLSWKSKMSTHLDELQLGNKAIAFAGNIIIEGLNLAHETKELLQTILCLHVECKKPLTVSQVKSLCTLVHVLKATQNTFNDNSQHIVKYTSGNTEHISFLIKKSFSHLRKKFESKKNPSPFDLDQLSTLDLIISLTENAPTPRVILLLKLAITVAFGNETGSSKELENIRDYIRGIDTFTTLSSKINEICDCSLLYWQRAVLPIFFEYIYNNPSYSPMLYFIFQGLEDVRIHLSQIEHLNDESEDLTQPGIQNLSNAYRDEILGYLNEQILEKLYNAVQEDITRQVHAQVNLDFENPFNKRTGTNDLRPFFYLEPIRFYDQLISFNVKVRHHLDVMFYKLTTASRQTQKAWQKYEEMRTLAAEKYGIEMTKVYLPGQTTDLGLDILEITRNIHVFVKNYSYNLHQNVFIERTSKSDSANLNTVSVKHVANSIRTHGSGIMNTTVNFVYQLLGRKLYTFSKFLYDDHIKSRLIRDAKFFKDNRHSLDNKYPLSRVEDFMKEIRSLGQIDGVSYLDKFRELITEIGNALAYIRMVRAAGLKYIANAVQFVPDLDGVEDFEVMAKEHNLSEETIMSGKNLTIVLKNLITQFAEGSDYFKMLEKVFSQELLKDNHKHLQNFYIILPPLTQNFVEYIIKSKDRMLRNGNDAGFTDDGFVLGASFILKVLNQVDTFKSLHWFQSIGDQHRQEYESWREKMNSPGHEDLNTMRLSLKRAEILQKEFQMVFFSFSGAQIFFQTDEKIEIAPPT